MSHGSPGYNNKVKDVNLLYKFFGKNNVIVRFIIEYHNITTRIERKIKTKLSEPHIF